MKKSIRVLALVLALTAVLFVFAACGKTLSGEYSAEIDIVVLKYTATYEFKGSKVTATKVTNPLIGESKTVSTNLPAQGIVTLMDQPSESRYVHHLLYASPVKRGNGIEIIEDILPLYEIETSLRLDKEPKRVYLAPAGTDLAYRYKDGVLTVQLPKLEIHAMIVIDY